jgi:hypothetical protein
VSPKAKPRAKAPAPTSSDPTVPAGTLKHGDVVRRADGSDVRLTSNRPAAGGWGGRPVVDGVDGELGPWIVDDELVTLVTAYAPGQVAAAGAVVDPVGGAA